MCVVTRHSIASLAIAAVATLAMACGGHETASPAAPSATAAAAPGSGAVIGATISGTVVGQGASSLASGRLRTLGVGLTVTVTGTATSAPVDGSGHFTLQNVPPGHVDIHFTGAGTDAHLGLDDAMDYASISISVVVSGFQRGARQRPAPSRQHGGDQGLVTATSASTITGERHDDHRRRRHGHRPRRHDDCLRGHQERR